MIMSFYKNQVTFGDDQRTFPDVMVLIVSTIIKCKCLLNGATLKTKKCVENVSSKAR